MDNQGANREGSKELKYVTAYAVIRIDQGPLCSPEHVQEYTKDGVSVPAAGPSNVQVKEIVMSAEVARSEVMRLNELNSANGCSYYWQSTHVFLNGESHGSKAK